MQKLLMASVILWSSLCLAANNDRVRLVPLPEVPNTKARARAPKQVPILSIKLTPAMVEMQQERLRHFGSSLTTRAADTTLPSRKDLGMNGVPILDQGLYGTCVTFAVTAAIDAALGKGDYISQLCLLQLSNTLSEYSYWDTAWKGSMGHRVIGEIRQYGIMTKADQRKGLCNNVKEYPYDFNEALTQKQMSLADYHKNSHNVLSNTGIGIGIEPQVLFKLANFTDYGDYDHFISIANYGDGWVSPEEALKSVRKSLADGNRVVISFLVNTHNMLPGRYKTDYDTWYVTKNLKEAFVGQKPIMEELDNWGYHEIVIYGYDDNITVNSTKGDPQKGVFMVRNSWGSELNNRGTEFMTYDYFKLMALDAYAFYTKK